MQDLISRQAAISAICNACGKIDCDKMDKCEKLQLPPANCSEFPNNCEHITEDGVTCAKYPACDDCLDNPLNKLKGSERLVKGSEQTDLVEDSPSLVKDLVKAFGEDGTWLERQGVYTLTLAEAKQRAVDIIESVLAKDKPTISKMEQVDKDINVRSKDEPQNCDTCRHHFGKDFDIECEVKAFGNECRYEPKDEPQTNADQHVQHVGNVERVEPTWTKEEHEAFYTFLWNVINPNEMQDYIEMFETTDEPQKWEKPPKFEHKGIQTACVSVPMALIEDEPQTERSE